ncbi:MAG TPA: BTAD domain-containing putative transcriptional regulator [Candidatus Nanopelagicales bacterium]
MTLAAPVPGRIQLCGALVVELGGHRLETGLPGRQGRLLFSYLTLHRHRSCGRDELSQALWGDHVPPAGDAGLNALISKLRRSLGPGIVEGRSSLHLMLGPDTSVDVEVAEKAAHKAESRVALGDWAHAWGPALAALVITERTFLPDDEAPWIDERRAVLTEIHLRALESYAVASLGIGGTELSSAVRAGRQLTRLVPLRESGYQVLMRALAAQGNIGEALLVHAELCRLLRDELGVSPGAATQAVYQALLHNDVC